jgi:glutathione S-transferase
MKLYYSKGACSLAPHILLRESGMKFEAIQVDLKTKQFGNGQDYKAINPKGYVPALQLDSGDVLTEAHVILQYIADQKGDGSLLPKFGSIERYHAMEWLGYIATELHKSYGPLFYPNTPADYRPLVVDKITQRYAIIDERLKDREYVLGKFSAVDAYLFVVTTWSGFLKVDLSKYTNVAKFMERMKGREKVREAMHAEHLM